LDAVKLLDFPANPIAEKFRIALQGSELIGPDEPLDQLGENDMQSSETLLTRLLTPGDSSFRFRSALRRIAQFCIKILPRP